MTAGMRINRRDALHRPRRAVRRALAYGCSAQQRRPDDGGRRARRWLSDRRGRALDGRAHRRARPTVACRIRVYHAGQLGRESDTVDLARFGALDITRVNFASLNNPFPLTRVFSLPYVFDSVEHMRRAVDGEAGRRRCCERFEQRDLIGLAIYDAGSRSFYNVRRPVRRAGGSARSEDSRAAVGHLHRLAIAALGANPTPLPFGEVYSALQTHLIEGAENNWRTFHTSRQFEVARYWSQTDHSYSPEALLHVAAHVRCAVAARSRDRARGAARVVPYMRELWDRMEAESRAHVLAAGVQSERGRSSRHSARAAAADSSSAISQDRDVARAVRRAFARSPDGADMGVTQPANSALGRALRPLARIAVVVAGVALVGMAAVEAWQVFARYVLNDSPSWTEPVALLLHEHDHDVRRRGRRAREPALRLLHPRRAVHGRRCGALLQFVARSSRRRSALMLARAGAAR